MSVPDPQGQALGRFLARARGSARRRAIAATLWDAILGGCVIAAAASAGAQWTDRGDLAQPAAAAVAAVLALGLLIARIRGGRRSYGSPIATARSIAATTEPLGRPGDPGDPLLRHEILGATELWLGHEAVGGSRALARRYVGRIAARVDVARIEPRRAVPGPRFRPRLVATVMAIALGAVAGPMLSRGFGLWLAGADGRPPTPPRPVWSALELELRYPEHTGRPPRSLPNPSGALRLPAGTDIGITLDTREPAAAAKVVVTYDATELSSAPKPEIVDLSATGSDGLRFSGTVAVRGAGNWTVVLLDDPDDELEDSGRRSAAMPLHLEPDRAPEVELMPLPRAARDVSESDAVDVRFYARDDFGLQSAVLVYQMPDGAAHRVTLPKPPPRAKSWRHRYTWDLRQIPVTERSEVLYWVEVRDNDPGLGLLPLADGPGKVTRSATMRLMVRDEEAEHARNVVKVREIRDAAVDLLAQRMTTAAFGRTATRRPMGSAPGSPAPGTELPPLGARAAAAREILARAETVLSMLASIIDTLSLDTLARPRDVATLTEIHGRLMKLHRAEAKLHEGMPPGSETLRGDDVQKVLATVGKHNVKEVSQLEDEIIRLDDLVDRQIIERLEGLVARLQATQQKLVELLEQLRAGDESVRAQIEQLERRRREDLRRIQEARAMLQKELGDEFMNLDAFKILEQMRNREDLAKLLERGEIDQALQQARGQLGQVRGLRDAVQQRLGQPGQQAQMTKEERDRMKLLRELSRLQDEEGNLRARTRRLHEAWRAAVSEQPSEADSRAAAKRAADKLARRMERINDARLGREGRRGYDDARDALQRLRGLAESKDASALDLAEAAQAAADAVGRAKADAPADEKEGRQLGQAKKEADALRRRLEAPLPTPGQALSQEQRGQFEELRESQQGLRKRAESLLDDDIARLLPQPGQAAMKRADRGMIRSRDELRQGVPRDAISGQSRAWQGLQEAIDSLRRGSPPPPPSSSSGDASTEAERDRSLRDALMETMREEAPSGYDAPVKRYFEELLR